MPVRPRSHPGRDPFYWWIRNKHAMPDHGPEITVKDVDGRQFRMHCELNSTVEHLKHLITDPHQYGGGFEFPLEDLVLIFAGKRLEDGRCLWDYNIQPGSTLFALCMARIPADAMPQ
eukprot:TRINITY_DN15318_c0_g1_i3.p1 TRINITY_DN15318_c0_g1~~TRINITY_DN15318_c0_g1_i3.p1  ORF type:complete len:117 (-),score=0.50 TRINITY_DN15318_c0_g1_i3:211-561(-)